MPKTDKQTRINANLGGGVPQSAGTLIINITETETLPVGGDPSKIGGWTIGPVTLSGGGTLLSSDGYIKVGQDGTLVRMDAQDAVYRLWAGAEAGADAPFSVTKEGVLAATGAAISGAITALTGNIGGWTIGAALTAGAGASAVGLAPGTYPFYAGAVDPAAAPFRVTAAGALVATAATITGAITATSGAIGTLNVTGLLTLVDPAAIQSSNYVANLRGWRIDHEGNLEAQNARIRGAINTAVFEYDQISATAGTLVVAPTAGVLALDYTANGTLTMVGAAWLFATNDIVRIRALNIAGDAVPVETWLKVTRTVTVNVYTTEVRSGDAVSTWPAGTAVVGYGTGGGSLLMTAALTGAPFYSVRTHGATPWADETEPVRLGNLRNTFGIGAVDRYGIGLGDYAAGNYLRYEPTSGLVLRGGDGNVSFDALGIRLLAGVGGATHVQWRQGAYDGPGMGGIYADWGGGAGDDGVTWVSALKPVGAGWKNTQVILSAYDIGTGVSTRLTVNSLGFITAWGALRYTGDLQPYRNATYYTGYVFVPLTTPATSTAFDGDLYDVDNDGVTIDLSVVFGLPARVKAVNLGVSVQCPTVGRFWRVGPSAAYGHAFELHTQVANQWMSGLGACPCDANGDIYFTTSAIHGTEMVVYMRIWGYWI